MHEKDALSNDSIMNAQFDFSFEAYEEQNNSQMMSYYNMIIDKNENETQ